MAIQSFRDLIAWQKAMAFAEMVYKETSGYPKEETYGLRSQLRNAAISVPSNIAEGQGRRSAREFLRFISIAYGSLCESQTQIMLSSRLSYLSEDAAERLLQTSGDVARLLNGLKESMVRSLENTP